MADDPAGLPADLDVVDQFYANGIDITVGRVGPRFYARCVIEEHTYVDVWARTGRALDNTLRGLFGAGGLSSTAHAALVEPAEGTPA